MRDGSISSFNRDPEESAAKDAFSRETHGRLTLAGSEGGDVRAGFSRDVARDRWATLRLALPGRGLLAWSHALATRLAANLLWVAVKRTLVGMVVVGWLFVAPGAAADQPRHALNYWPQWRGPLGTGVAPLADPPVNWSEDQNVRWKIQLPGSGHSTPVIWDDRIFLTSGFALLSGASKIELVTSGALTKKSISQS